MSRKSGRSVSVTLSCFSIAVGRISSLDCRDCKASLDIHQPNPNQPDQFLGTCSDCGSWFRIDADAAGGRAMVIRLPDSREVVPSEPQPSETS